MQPHHSLPQLWLLKAGAAMLCQAWQFPTGVSLGGENKTAKHKFDVVGNRLLKLNALHIV